MLTNNKVTIYHKSLDNDTKLEKWTRYNYDKVWIFNRDSANITNQINNTNNIDIRIPYNDNNINTSNHKLGDVIVIGHIDLDINTIQDLKDYKTYVIDSITDNKTGNNQHIHIGGK